MGFRGVRLFACALITLGFTGSPVFAQDRSWGELAVSAAAVEFDLSGVGNTPALAIRATHDVSPHVVLEFRGLYARPAQQFGPSTLLIPEAQVQYRWNVARLSPFVGVGGGAARIGSSFGAEWDPTLSFAGGTGVRLTPQLGLVGVVRLRGHEWRFTGSTAEIGLGLAWQFPSF